MDAIELYLKFHLFPKGLESLKHDGNYKLRNTYSHGC